MHKTTDRFYNKYGKSAISLDVVSKEKVERYGRSEVEPDIYVVDGLVEKPPSDKASSNLAIMGGYA